MEASRVSVSAAESLRRDVRIIGLVGSAHFVSHFFQLTLPPLFPLLKNEFGVAYVALGLVMSVFYAASGIGQTVSGFLVDRFGAHPLLVAGIGLLAGSVALASLSRSYWMLVTIALLAGLGNSVFHPADYSIFNTLVDPRRLGRAYSVHSICGNFGWVAAPLFVVTVSGVLGWRTALVTAGGLGLAAAALVGSRGELLTDHREPAARRGAARSPDLSSEIRLLLAAPILLAFAYFALLAMSLVGLQTFAVPAMLTLYDAPLTLATGALTAFLLGNAAGILAGGFLADRARRHDLVAATGLLLAAALTLVVGQGLPPTALVPGVLGFAGFCLGATGPSRDMLVRGATPAGASGKVFGFVYSGLDLGSLLTPVVFGWLLDRGKPRMIFLLAAAVMLLTIVTVVQVRRHSLLRAPYR
jgi:MFS family permease